jgi:arylformamidase
MEALMHITTKAVLAFIAFGFSPSILGLNLVFAQAKVTKPTFEEKYKGDLALDFYKATAGENAPLVVFIHGGGWKQGDKKGFRRAAAVFNEAGFAAASINYGLYPVASVETAAADVAAAVNYLKQNAGRLGFDGKRISLVGHSAGAYYAALVASNKKYLPTGVVKAIALLDCRACDVASEMKRKRAEGLRDIFGSDPVRWKSVSPSTYIDAHDPKIWLAFILSNRNSEIDATSFATLVKNAGGSAEAEGFSDVNHVDFVKKLGDTNFGPTKQLMKFLKEAGQ